MTPEENLARMKAWAEQMEALKYVGGVAEVRERRAREDYAEGRIDEATLEQRIGYEGTFR